jgi:hypothetical protein
VRCNQRNSAVGSEKVPKVDDLASLACRFAAMNGTCQS